MFSGRELVNKLEENQSPSLYMNEVRDVETCFLNTMTWHLACLYLFLVRGNICPMFPKMFKTFPKCLN